MTDGYTLTDAGWPRPRVNGWPVPWVAPAENLGEVNDGRRIASASGAVCQVCGEGWPWDGEAFGFITVAGDFPLIPDDYLTDGGMPPAKKIFFLDGALMHHRCAALTAALCPHIKAQTNLICVKVPANDADPVVDETGKLLPTYPAGDVQVAVWPI